MYLYKGVDTHDGQIWLRLGVIDQVEVNEFFELQVIRLHAERWSQQHCLFNFLNTHLTAMSML